MPQSTLSKIINRGDSEKVRIGYTDGMSAYTDVLKKMGNVYGKQVVLDYSGKTIEENTNLISSETQKALTSGLGTFQLQDEKADVEGLFASNQMAAIAICPFLTFPYKDRQNTNDVLGACFDSCEQTNGGYTLSGRRLTVPYTYDEATLDACHTDNAGDFVIGCGINLSGDFANTYVNRFYSGRMEVKHLLLLAKKQYLYGEVFFPVETSGAKVMVCPVIADTMGNAQVHSDGQLTYYLCYVPTPLMMLSGYNDVFQVADKQGYLISEATYGSDALYSYVKGTIEGFSPQVMKQYVNQNKNPLPMAVASMAKWPGEFEGAAVFGRFRFCVPTQFETQAREIIGKDAPQELFGLSDNSISTGLKPVQGSNADYNVSTSELMYFPAEQYEGKISAGMYWTAMRYVWASEGGTDGSHPYYDRTTMESDGLNLGMYSIGKKWGNLKTYVKHYYAEPDANPAFVEKWKQLESRGFPDKEAMELWKETYRGDMKPFCHAQWTEFWDYVGRKACDAFVSGGYTSVFALMIIIELGNWRPGWIIPCCGSNPANGDEKTGLLNICACIKTKNKGDGSALKKMRQAVEKFYPAKKDDLHGVQYYLHNGVLAGEGLKY